MSVDKLLRRKMALRLAYRDNRDPRLLQSLYLSSNSYNTLQMADEDLAALNALEKEAKEFDKV